MTGLFIHHIHSMVRHLMSYQKRLTGSQGSTLTDAGTANKATLGVPNDYQELRVSWCPVHCDKHTVGKIFSLTQGLSFLKKWTIIPDRTDYLIHPCSFTLVQLILLVHVCPACSCLCCHRNFHCTKTTQQNVCST